MRRPIFAALLLALLIFWQAPANAQTKRDGTQEENKAVASDQAGGDEKIFTPKEVEKKAIIKSRPVALSVGVPHREEISITLRAIFRKTGEVTDITVYKVRAWELSDKEIKSLVKDATEAASKIKFIPAMKNGQAVSQYMQIEYHLMPDAR